MSLTSWLKTLSECLTGRSVHSRAFRRKSVALARSTETLEIRTLLSANYLVDSFADVVDGDYSAGNLSLREAVLLANSDGVDSTINLSAGTFLLTISGSQDDAGLTGDLDIQADGMLTIIGRGAGTTVIDAGGAAGIGDRVLDSFGALTLDSLTVTGGTVTDSTFGSGRGGGIRHSGLGENNRLRVINSEVSGNSTTGSLSGGGGIGAAYLRTSEIVFVEIVNSVISHNSANTGGGVLAGALWASESEFHNNAGIDGGAIQAAQLEILDSAIHENTAYRGAALYLTSLPVGDVSRIDGVSIYNNSSLYRRDPIVHFDGFDHQLIINNSTIAFNVGIGFHTSLSSSEYTSHTEFNNVTITGNTEGGVRLFNDATVTLNNSIVAGNGSAHFDSDISSLSNDGADGAFNLIGNPAFADGLQHSVDANLLGVDGVNKLTAEAIFADVDGDGEITVADLVDDGGLTRTLLLRPDSLAVDSGSDALALAAGLTSDQRGRERFQGAAVDRGAVELFQGTYTVTVFEDENDGDISVDDLSLREAVLLANQDGLDSTIILANGTYLLTIAGAQEDAGLTGDLDIFADGSMTILGQGAGQTIISAGGSGGIRDRVLDGFTTLTLDSVTVTGGYLVRESGFPAQVGGGIRYALTTAGNPLSVRNSEVIGNRVVGGLSEGGGIGIPRPGTLANRGRIIIENSIISDNYTSGNGGGISAPTVIASNTLFENNSGLSDGGGIWAQQVIIADSAFRGNQAGDGAALMLLSNSSSRLDRVSIYENESVTGAVYFSGLATLDVLNSTIVGNTGGRGFYTRSSSESSASRTTFTNTTIAGNTHSGIRARDFAYVNLNNSVVAGNYLENPSNPVDIADNGRVTGSYNLIGTTQTIVQMLHGVNGNIVGNAGVGSIDATAVFVDLNGDGRIDASDLADNGGPTRTLALATNSLATDSGSDSIAANAELETDQRGDGFARISGQAVDRGAFEIQSLGNEQPEAASGFEYTHEDAGEFSMNLNALVSDPDLSDVLAITDIVQDSGRTIGFSAVDGLLSFDTAQFHALAVGESATLTFTYTVDDQQGQANSTATGIITITIDGRNDSPAVNGNLVANLTEDDPPVAVDLLAGATDPDTADLLMVDNLQLTAGVAPGINVDRSSLIIDPSAWNFLAVGEQAILAYSYDVIDGNGGRVSRTATITITGLNDNPLALPVSETVGEDGPALILAADYSDVDATDAHTVTFDTTGTLGVVVNNNDGTFRYEPGRAFDSLAAGETAIDTFTYNVDDGNGGISSASVNITLKGANDQPVASNALANTDEDAGVFSVNLNALISDPDLSDVLAITGIVQDSGRSIGFAAVDGVLSFDTAQFHDLAVGESATLTFTYTVDDQQGQANSTAAGLITITVDGRNDSPAIAATSANDIFESQMTTLEVEFEDADLSDQHLVTVVWRAPSGQVVGTDSQIVIGNGLNRERTATFTRTFLDDNPSFTSADSWSAEVTVLELDENNPSPQSATDSATFVVSNLAPEINAFVNTTYRAPASAYSTDGVPGQTLSFVGTFTDQGTQDTHIGYIHLGDGTNWQQVVIGQGAGVGTVRGSHVFTRTGTFNVRVYVRDDDGGSALQTFQVTIAPVALLPDTIQFGRSTLYIGGTLGSDKIVIQPSRRTRNPDVVEVVLNNNLDRLQYLPTGRIMVFGQAGDDTIRIDRNVSQAAWIYGGDGNDRLYGGGGNNVLLGEAGNDYLFGGSGSELLIGGDGRDTIYGNGGNDILLAGSPSADTKPHEEQLLFQVVRSWIGNSPASSRAEYVARIEQVHSLLDGRVGDDGARDSLIGGRGLDWFIWSPEDRARDLRNRTFENDIDWILNEL